MNVPARLSVVTLGVADLPRAVSFYEKLGWERASSSDEAISWFRTADSWLGLFPRDDLAADAALPAGPIAPFSGITLAICVASEDDVAPVLEAAVAAGARMLKPATRAGWGGVSGYFADPDGHPWEVAYVPSFSLGADGRITIP